MKLTKQERIAAIVIVILIILVAGVFMFIKPNIETIIATQANLKTKEQEYNDDVKKVARKDELKNQIIDAYDKGKNLADMFFPELAAYEADNEFRAFLSQCKANVLVEDLQVTEPTTAELATNIFIPAQVQYALKDYVNQGTKTDITKTDPNLVRQAYIQAALGNPQTIGATTVTVTVKATEIEELLKFADEVNNYQLDENGNKTRKAMQLSGIAFEDLKTTNEYNSTSEKLLAEAEKAAAEVFKSKTGKTLKGSENNNNNTNDTNKKEEEESEVEEVYHMMECSITFYSIERMQDPTEKLNAQDSAAGTTTANANTSNTSNTSTTSAA